jgi:peroxiredoxin
MSKHFFAAFILTLCLWGFDAFALEEAVNIFAQSRPVPTRKIQDTLGKNVTLSDFKGDFVLAVFWSRNCAPCIQELKSLAAFQKKVKANRIKVILISTKEEWVSASEEKRFLARFGASNIESFFDPKGQLASDLGIFSTPSTALINTKSEEIGRIRGSAQWDDIQVVRYIYKLKRKYGS